MTNSEVFKKILLPIIIATGLPVFIYGAYFVYQISKEADEKMARYEEIAPSLKTELGFELGSPYYQINGDLTEVTEFEIPPGDSVMGAAGVRNGDFLVHFEDLFEALEQSRGGQLTFYVVPGGDGPLLRERERREITVKVPLKQD